MAKYTIELRDVIKNHGTIFPFNYEFYDEKKRFDFESDFVKHFYFREICTPDVKQFIAFLEDKMHVVFPAYNEALKALQIEYNVLDNYFLSETTSRTVESKGKSSGVSSSRGHTFEDTQTNTTGKSTNDGETSVNNSETVNGNTSKTSAGTAKTNSKSVKKGLDTPQGAIDFSDNRYVTGLNEETADGTNTTNGNETGTDNRTTTGEGKTTNKNTQNDESSITVTGEGRTIADNNTRTDRADATTEKTEIIHKGNIGVDSDAVMIQKHLKLQQLIANTKKMFFDECEDLFILVM